MTVWKRFWSALIRRDLLQQRAPGLFCLPFPQTDGDGNGGRIHRTGLLFAVLAVASLLSFSGCNANCSEGSYCHEFVHNIEVALYGPPQEEEPTLIQQTTVDVVGPGTATIDVYASNTDIICMDHCENVDTDQSGDSVSQLIADSNGFVSWTCYHDLTTVQNPVGSTDLAIGFIALGISAATHIHCVALFDPDVHTLTLVVQGAPDIYSDVSMTPGQPQDAVCFKDGEPASSAGTDRCSCKPGNTCLLNPVRGGTSIQLEATNPAYRLVVTGVNDPDCFDKIVTMNQDKTCTFSLGYPTLNAHVTGHGRVFSLTNGGIDCQEGDVGTCTGGFPFQSIATLVAEPSIGGHVGGWSGDCSGTAQSANVQMGDDRDCTVTLVGGIAFGQAGVVELVSLDPADGDLIWDQGGSFGATGGLALSADGRTVAFRGAVPGSVNRTYFARDVAADTTEAVANDGSSGGGTTQVAVSADGRYVAFDSNDPGLPGNSTPPLSIGRRIFVKDLTTGDVQLVSTGDLNDYFGDPNLQVGIRDEAGADAAISADGRYVVFEGRLVRTLPPAAPVLEDSFRIFVRDTCAGGPSLCTPSTRIVSVTGDRRLPGPTGRNSTRPTISADGRYVAFLSSSTFLSTDGSTDGIGPMQIFLHDRDADGNGVFDEAPLSSSSPDRLSTEAISLTQTPSGQPLSRLPERPVMSANARYIVYQNSDTGLFDELGSPIFMYDTCIGAETDSPCSPSTTPIVFFGDPAGSDRNNTQHDVSGDGRFVSVNGVTPNFIFGILVQDTCLGSAPVGCTPDTRFISIDRNGNPATAQFGRISGDGRAIAFESNASNLLSSGTGALPDVFLAQTGFITMTDSIPGIDQVQGAPFALGTGDQLVTIEGVGFVPGSTVLWNGESRRTIYLDRHRLQFRTRAEDLDAISEQSVISVVNPNGRTSGTVWVGPTL
jgi:hypothetical protein